MANLKFSADLVNEILSQNGELTDGTSDFDARALVVLNRAYKSMWMGGTELDPTINEDWWWLLGDPPLTLTLEPRINGGTVSVTNNSLTATFSATPTPLIDSDVANWFLKVGTHSDVMRVSSMATAVATLDSVYTGATDTAAGYALWKLDYSLNSNVLRMVSPLRVQAEGRDIIEGIALSELEQRYPLRLMQSGVPRNFAHVAEQKIRMSHYGLTTSTGLIRVEYDYLKLQSDLTDSGSEEPAVPIQYRQLLADFGAFFLFKDKNDNRADGAGLLARAGLKAMANENRHKMASHSRRLGQIDPRPEQINRALTVPRTESGVIIG